MCVARIHKAFTWVCVLSNDTCFTEGKITGLFLIDQLLEGSVLLSGEKTDSVNADMLG